jgi:glycosyltransferase involved in cell wall biosynthesis
VDNDSADSTVTLVSSLFPAVELIRLSHNTGFANANNVGLTASKVDWVVLLNPDATLEPDWLAILHQFASVRPRAGMLGGVLWRSGDRIVVDSLGIKQLIVTNAAGGINPRFNPGDLMLIEDHINFMGVNPLIGGTNGNRFIDMTQAYSSRLREKLVTAAEKLKIPVWNGVYLATAGPSYETPAEVKAFAWWGADAVGMSTVPEVIIARYHNIEVAGISCITNLAAGISSKKLSHDDVIKVGLSVQDKLGKLLTEFLASL